MRDGGNRSGMRPMTAKRYCILMLASRITFAHLATSALIQAPNSSGELPIGSKPSVRELLLHVRQRQRLDDLPVEQVDHRPRRAGRHQDADEHVGLLIAGSPDFDHRRHVRQRR